MAVASSLLRVQSLLDSVAINSGAGGIDTPVRLSNLQALEKARSAAWDLVQRARQREKNQDEELEQLSEDHVSVILYCAEDPLHPECTFLVGAMIWWKLINIWLIDNSVSTRALGFNGQRAELALSYLLRASDRGYTNANLEISLAYAALYHNYKNRVSFVFEF